jgi:hypothetical protein
MSSTCAPLSISPPFPSFRHQEQHYDNDNTNFRFTSTENEPSSPLPSHICSLALLIQLTLLCSTIKLTSNQTTQWSTEVNNNSVAATTVRSTHTFSSISHTTSMNGHIQRHLGKAHFRLIELITVFENPFHKHAE